MEHIGRVKTQKPSKKVNFTTTNAILMKLTTVMYLHESVNRKALRARNAFFWLNLIASLLKLLYKYDNILGSIP